MKNKIITFLGLIIFIFLVSPIVSYASVNPTLVRILNYYQDSDGRITFRWQQDYDGCKASGFDCSGGVQLSTAQFASNGGEGFYDGDDNFGAHWGFMNFTTTCNELTATGRICISHPKILINRNNNDNMANNSSGLLYSDVAGYVNAGGKMHTILGGIFRVISDVNYRISDTNDFSFGDVELPYIAPVVVKNPILIVPGLMGTEMKSGDEFLWPDMGRMLTDIGDNFMDPLQFDNNLKPINNNLTTGNIVGSVAIIEHFYDGLITEFKNQGYIENETLFTFPYDWRYGASGKYPDGSTNEDLLAQKIQDILTQTGADKVDVVAHSEGGLIVKKYVVDHQTNNHIGKAVFVGVPNTGAPKTIKVLLQGDNFGIPWLSQNEMKKIAENIPVAYDLLPSHRYYDTKGSFVKVVDEGDLDNFNDYTQKDLNYQEFGSFLTDDHSLNSQALTGAQNLHTADFDNFDLRIAGVDLYAIDGCKTGTLGKIIEDRFKNIFGQSFTEYKNPKFTPGDGTVPLESATNLPIDDSHKFYSLTGEHSKMLSQDGSRQEIVNLLAGSTLAVDSKFISQDILKCNLNGKAISVFSPIDILVTDQNGNHLGNAADGSVVSEIPNATVEIFGDHKFLYLPTDDGQTYTTTIQGTGTGTYTINSQNVTNNQITSTEVFSNLPVTPDLSGNINLGAQTTLTLQQTPGGAIETILPSAVINADQSEDVASPISAATLSGIAGQVGFYRSDMNVSINAQDQIIAGRESQTSGVLSLQYNLDNAGYQKIVGNSANITVSNPGSHDVTFFAIDNNGNKEVQQTVYFVIDKIAPEAVMQFDLAGKNIKITGTDNISNSTSLAMVNQSNSTTITDQAGNVTVVGLAYSTPKTSTSVQVTLVQYNGTLFALNKNQVAFSWSYDRNNNLSKVSQVAKSNNGYNISATYNGTKTTITGTDASGKFSQTFNGLKIIKVSTLKGDVAWSY